MAFYVYQYLTESGTPYYIGKGCGRRIHVEHTGTELPPVERRIIIKDGLTNEEAKKLEGELITKYGRKLDGGILDNIKINQWACHTGWTHSEETKRKISEVTKVKFAQKNIKQITVSLKLQNTLKKLDKQTWVARMIQQELLKYQLLLKQDIKHSRNN